MRTNDLGTDAADVQPHDVEQVAGKLSDLMIEKPLAMLIEDARICQTLRRIVTRVTPDRALQDDLMQECLIRLWRLESEEPGRTRSWYLQNCRFHVQHWLAAGRSLDSPKRANGDLRLTIDGTDEELPVEDCHTNDELLEMVCAHDIVATLACHLKPAENAVLGALADGLVLHDIALKLNVSYPTALKYRRKIAALTIKLGISPPLPYKRHSTHQVPRAHRVHCRHVAGQMNRVQRHKSSSLVFGARRREW